MKLFWNNRVALLQFLTETPFCEHKGLLRNFGTVWLIEDILWTKILKPNKWTIISHSNFCFLRISVWEIKLPSLKGNLFYFLVLWDSTTMETIYCFFGTMPLFENIRVGTKVPFVFKDVLGKKRHPWKKGFASPRVLFRQFLSENFFQLFKKCVSS